MQSICYFVEDRGEKIEGKKRVEQEHKHTVSDSSGVMKGCLGKVVKYLFCQSASKSEQDMRAGVGPNR